MDRTRPFTHIVSLDSQDGPWPHPKIRYDIRTGLKADSEIVRLERPEQIDDFYHLYRMTARRHGGKGPFRDKKFFEILFDYLHNTDKLYWTGLLAEDSLVGSQIHFIHENTLFNWQTVSNYEKRQYKPSQLLMNDAVEKAISLGLGKVNLGASPSDAGGLIRYKERWRGTRIEYNIYTSRSRLRRLIRR
jgi:lipid II:glycine glycyltransferase (peptidoglycan interpeptide bridge formation enzyme)